MANEPTLRRGDEGDWVQYLQEMLNHWGIDPGPIDGRFGPLTEAAVRQAQQQGGLTVDGDVGTDTWNLLTAGSGAMNTDRNEVTGRAISVDHSVTLVNQQDGNSCWAAGAAMLLNWRDGTSLTDADVIAQVGDMGGDGANEPETQAFANHFRLRLPGPMSMTPEGWEQLLQSGPVMVGIPRHYVVVAGIRSDGSMNNTQLHIFDPGGTERWGDYLALEQIYEIDAGSGANLVQP